MPGGFFVRKNDNEKPATSEIYVENIGVDKGLDGWYSERDTKDRQTDKGMRANV